jgi:L-fucose mutarotase/ribose pyranase (RbsD/FucU family)
MLFTGGTDFYPSAASDAETLTVTGLVIIGSFIWTAVLAAFCDVATNSNPALTEFRQNLDSLNLFIAINELPIDMALRLRSFMHQQKGVQLQEDAKRALPRISPVLQVEVVLYIHRQWLGSIWFIRDLEAAVKVRLAMSMEPKVLAPGEVAPTRMLYVVQRGKVMFNGRILSRGMVWGDDIILQDSRYCLPCLARAIVYTDLTQLSQAKLSEIVSTYPASRTSLRRSTVRLAFRRHIVVKAREQSARLVKESQELGKDQPENLLRRPQGDFMDRVEDAASVKMSDNQEQSMTIALELNKHVSYRTASPDPHGDQGVSGVEDGNALKLEVLGALSDLRAHMDQQLGRVSAELAEMRKEFKTIKEI